MTGLDPRASQLVALGRRGADPSDAEIEALREALIARLGNEPSGAPDTEAAAAAGPAALKLKAVAATAALIAGGVAGFAWLSPKAASSPAASVAPRQVTTPLPAPARSLPSADVAAPDTTVVAAEPVSAAEQRARFKPGTRPTPPLRLEDEAALLAEVQGALRAGRPVAALGKLDEYERRFGLGMLRAEAEAARVLAWCAAGQVDRARAAAARFVQRYPSSPSKARVQSACAAKAR